MERYAVSTRPAQLILPQGLPLNADPAPHARRGVRAAGLYTVTARLQADGERLAGEQMRHIKSCKPVCIPLTCCDVRCAQVRRAELVQLNKAVSVLRQQYGCLWEFGRSLEKEQVRRRWLMQLVFALQPLGTPSGSRASLQSA